MNKPDEETARSVPPIAIQEDVEPAAEFDGVGHQVQSEPVEISPEDFAGVTKWTKKDLRRRRRSDSEMLAAAGVSKKDIGRLRRLQRAGKGDKVVEWYEEQRRKHEDVEESEEA